MNMLQLSLKVVKLIYNREIFDYRKRNSRLPYYLSYKMTLLSISNDLG